MGSIPLLLGPQTWRMNLEEFSRNRPNTDLAGGYDVRGSIPLEVIDAHLLLFLWYIPHFFNTSTPVQPQFLLCFTVFFYLFCILTCGVYDSSLPQVEAPLRYISGGSLLPGIKFVINIERLTPSFYPALTHFLISPSPPPPLMFFVLIIDAESRCQNFCVCWVAY